LIEGKERWVYSVSKEEGSAKLERVWMLLNPKMISGMSFEGFCVSAAQKDH